MTLSFHQAICHGQLPVHRDAIIATTTARETAVPSETWPPPIIETDPVALYTHIVQQWTAVRFYRLLLQSAKAEQSVRYQLMESAGQNAERLIDELSGMVQATRQ